MLNIFKLLFLVSLIRSPVPQSMTSAEIRQQLDLLNKATTELEQSTQDENGYYTLDLAKSSIMAEMISFSLTAGSGIFAPDSDNIKRLSRFIDLMLESGDTEVDTRSEIDIKLQLQSNVDDSSHRRLDLNGSSVTIRSKPKSGLWGFIESVFLGDDDDYEKYSFSFQDLFAIPHSSRLHKAIRSALIASFPSEYLGYINGLDSERRVQSITFFIEDLYHLRDRPYFVDNYFKTNNFSILFYEVVSSPEYSHLSADLSEKGVALSERIRRTLGETDSVFAGKGWLDFSGEETESSPQVTIHVMLTPDRFAEYQEQIEWAKDYNYFLLDSTEEFKLEL